MSAWCDLVDGVADGFAAVATALRDDAGALVLFVLAGVFYSLLYPFPYRAEVIREVRVALVDEDGSSMSRQLARYFDAHPSVQLVLRAHSLAEARAALESGQVDGIALLPAGLRNDVLHGRDAGVSLYGHGGYLLQNQATLGGLAEASGTLAAGVALRRAMAAGASWHEAQARRDPVRLIVEPLFNTTGGYGAYVVPAVALLIVQQTSLIGIAMLIGGWLAAGGLPGGTRSRRHGRAQALGLLVGFACLGLVQCLYFAGFVTWLYDYPWSGRVLPLAGLAALFALAIAGAGMLVGLVLRQRERALQILLPLSIPILFVAGYAWPTELLPRWLAELGLALPTTTAIDAIVRIDQMGARPDEVARSGYRLAALALGYPLLAVALLGRAFAGGARPPVPAAAVDPSASPASTR